MPEQNIDPLQLPEIFVRLGTDPASKLVVDGEPCFSADAVANEAFKYLLQGYEEEQIELVLTTHGRNATEECRAIFAAIRAINDGLVDLGFEYRLFETVAENAERLRKGWETNDPPRKWLAALKGLERRGFY